ncbi:hypothetical protein EON65_33230 [archaeon]|nr:MAG: hypothetical protein EON65_33230 [archaeon]
MSRSEKLIKYGVSFSPAGLLTPFHIGASAQLQKFGIITPDTALAGSSGGALAAVTTALETSSDMQRTAENDPLNASIYVAKRCRDYGARLTLRQALDEVLNNVLPINVHTILSTRAAPVIISYTEVNVNPWNPTWDAITSWFSQFTQFTDPFASNSSANSNKTSFRSQESERQVTLFDVRSILTPQYVNVFNSKQDVIECLLASCNIPFYFNGNNLCITARGKDCIDGFFGVSLNRFGCPHTPAKEREILICPYSPKLVQLNPNRPIRVPNISMKTFLASYRAIVNNINRALNMPPEASNAVPPLTANLPVEDPNIDTEDYSNKVQYDIISPDLLDAEFWPFSTQEVIKMSLTCPDSSKNPELPISDEVQYPLCE